jgi:hypothetical protein
MFDHIRRRLTMGYVGILALILLVFGVVVVFSFYLRVGEQQDDLLLQKAEDKANGVLNGRDKYSAVKATTDYDVAVIVLLPDGSTYGDLDETSLSLGLPYTYMAERAGQEKQTIKETVPGPGGAVRVMSIPIKKYGSVVAVVQAAQSRQAVSETVERLIFVLVLTGLGALVLAAAGGLYMSRRAMLPVQEAFGRQRAFIADASHELKTPLTLIRADAEVLSRGVDDPHNSSDNRELVDDLLGETDRMSAEGLRLPRTFRPRPRPFGDLGAVRPPRQRRGQEPRRPPLGQASCARRLGPHGPDPRRPPRQRPPLHPCSWVHNAGKPYHRQTGRGDRHGHRAGDSHREPGSHLRAFLQGRRAQRRQKQGTFRRRYRPRSRHRP